jgi:hypothetical protein
MRLNKTSYVLRFLEVAKTPKCKRVSRAFVEEGYHVYFGTDGFDKTVKALEKSKAVVSRVDTKGKAWMYLAADAPKPDAAQKLLDVHAAMGVKVKV